MSQLEIDEDNLNNVYTGHLSEVNQSKKVIATEDIYNAQRVLLVRKGAELDSRAANKIIQFKLLTPLEQQVAIEDTIDGRKIFAFILKGIGSDTAASSIHNNLNIEDELRELCLAYNNYPILVQKLTVLYNQLPQLFQTALITAYVSYIIAHKMNLDFESKKVVFLAGLCHDFSMLHLDPSLVAKNENFTIEEQKALKVHPIVGEKILSNVPNLPAGVSHAVLQHHERTDGGGYPRGLWADKLSIESQILAFVDSIYSVYRKRLVIHGYTIKELIPVMQMNSSLHFYRVYEAMTMIIRNAQLPDKYVVKDEDMPLLIDELLKDFLHFVTRYKAGMPLLRDLPRGTQHRKLNIANASSDRLYTVISSCGLLLPEYRDWLLRVKEEQLTEEYMDVERAALEHAEYYWHQHELDEMLAEALTEHPDLDDDIRARIKDWLALAEQLNQQREQDRNFTLPKI